MAGVQTKWDKLHYRLKRLQRESAWQLGRQDSFLWHARGARIIVYHGVCQNDHLKFNTLFVKYRMLEEHLRFYKKYFEVISLDDYFNKQFNPDRFNLCITFDDGFYNNYKYVLPLIEKYHVPAAFFITGISEAGYDILWNDALAIVKRLGPPCLRFQDQNFIRNRQFKYVSEDGGKTLVGILREADFVHKAAFIDQVGHYRLKVHEDYWRQMNREEIREISRSKWVSIGSHGYYHNDFANLSIAEELKELNRSKQFLEQITGTDVRAIAFPYGSYKVESPGLAMSSGFDQVLATDFIFSDDQYQKNMRERLTINPFISNYNQMHAIITGEYR